MFRGCRAWPLLRQLAGVAGGTATWLGADTVPGKGSIFLAALFGLRTPIHARYIPSRYLPNRYLMYGVQWSKGPRTGSLAQSANKESDTESGSHLSTNWQPRNARRTIFSISIFKTSCDLCVAARVVPSGSARNRPASISGRNPARYRHPVGRDAIRHVMITT